MQQYYRQLTFLIAIFLLSGHARSQSHQTIIYKKIDSIELKMDIYGVLPEKTKLQTAIVFYFGGGWIGGDRSQFIHQAEYFAGRGAVCFLVDYRIRTKYNSTPFDALEDAKSAMRYVRSHAQQYNIDSSRIVAAGGSAGGHLAAATALITGFNDKNDDLTVSCIPNALLLFNAVVDNGPGGYGFERVGEAYKEFSPLHNIHRGAPPTIIFQGTNDKLIPVETVQYFQKVMEKVGAVCELKLYKGQPHGFFNYAHRENYEATLTAADEFLTSIHFLEKKP